MAKCFVAKIGNGIFVQQFVRTKLYKMQFGVKNE